MNKRPDTLKVRADERRVQLVANLAALKGDTRPEAAAQMAKTKKQLTASNSRAISWPISRGSAISELSPSWRNGQHWRVEIASLT